MAAIDRPTDAGEGVVSAASRRLRRAGLPRATESADNGLDVTAGLEALDVPETVEFIDTDPTPYDRAQETGEVAKVTVTPATDSPPTDTPATGTAPSANGSTQAIPVVDEVNATPISGVPVAKTAPLARTAPVPVPDGPKVPTVPVLVRPATEDATGKVPVQKRATTTVRRRAKPRVRRVRRVVRSIDTWTVFKISALFFIVLYAILLVAGVLLWNLAYATGTIDNLENFFESFGWETFEFNGGQIYHSAWIAGLFVAAGGTGMNVVLATVFNLIADLVGGVGVTVLEEEVRIVADDSYRTNQRID